MKTLSLTVDSKSFDNQLARIKDIDPSLLCLFFSPEYSNSHILKEITNTYKDIPVVGCSTAGEISNDALSSGGMSIMALNFEDTIVETSSEISNGAEDSYRAARTAAEKMPKENLAGVLVLAPGLNINGSEVVGGVTEVFGSDVTVFGGLAGDNVSFNETFTFINGSLSNNAIVLVGFYGSKIKIKASSKGGGDHLVLLVLLQRQPAIYYMNWIISRHLICTKNI